MMKNLISLYFDSGVLKVAVFEKVGKKIKIKKLISSYPNVKKNEVELVDKYLNNKYEDEVDFDGVDLLEDESKDIVDIEKLSSALKELKLSKSEILLSVAYPEFDFHPFETELNNEKEIKEAIIEEIEEQTGFAVGTDLIGFITTEEKKYLASFIKGELKALNLLKDLSRLRKTNNKIVSIKNSEIALANFVIESKEIFTNEHSLIIYLDKYFSSLIFLKGKSIFHIGEKLDFGTGSEIYSEVFSSKIFYEMEKCNFTTLDNIFLCGENIDEEVRMKFYINFPEAKVKILEINSLEFDASVSQNKGKNCSFVIPITSGLEYFKEQEIKEKIGISILPSYIKEEQKSISVGWHGFLLILTLFASTFFLTQNILEKRITINSQQRQIKTLEAIKSENSDLLEQINVLSSKVNNFSNTKSVLDSLTIMNREWSKKLKALSRFAFDNKNFWVKSISSDNNNSVLLNGYSLSRSVLTDLARFNKSSTLNSVMYEPLKKMNTYKFNLKFPLTEVK